MPVLTKAKEIVKKSDLDSSSKPTRIEFLFLRISNIHCLDSIKNGSAPVGCELT